VITSRVRASRVSIGTEKIMVTATQDDLPPTVWKGQAEQVPPHSARNGIQYMGDESDGVSERLLCYDDNGALQGIFKFFPRDVSGTEPRSGNKWTTQAGVFIILVHPDHQRQGVGMKLLQAADVRWKLNFKMQKYTESGAALVNEFLSLRD
jgi:GNAT superfamily N-acetyltransferase